MTIRLRPATREDSDRLLAWRNDPDVVRTSATASAVAPREHERWLAARLQLQQPRLWIAEIDGVAVGQVRLDVDRSGTGVVSVAVAREHRGRGIAVDMLRALADLAGSDPEVRIMVAHVREDNEPSLHAFRRAGYDPRRQAPPGWLEMRRTVKPRGR